MATPSKAQFLNDVHTLLKKRYKPEADGPPGSRCSRRSSTGSATRGRPASRPTRPSPGSRTSSSTGTRSASARSRRSRGPSPACPTPRAGRQRIRRFLRQLFEKTYGFNLEPLTKKPLKESLKALQEYEAFDVGLRHGHRHPAGPRRPRHPRRRPDPPRPGTAGRDRRARPTPHAVRRILERAVPKNRGVEFVDLIEELAHDTCVEGVPDCPRCELQKICPTGQARLAERRAQRRPPSRPPRTRPATRLMPRPPPSPNPRVPSEPS